MPAAKDRLAPVAAIQDVIRRFLEFDACFGAIPTVLSNLRAPIDHRARFRLTQLFTINSINSAQYFESSLPHTTK